MRGKAYIFIAVFGLWLVIAPLSMTASASEPEETKSDAKDKSEDSANTSYELSAYTGYGLETGIPQTNLILNSQTGQWEGKALLHPRKFQDYGFVGASAAGEWDPAKWLALNVLLYSGEIRDGTTLPIPVNGVTSNGNLIGDEYASGSFVCELSAGFTSGGFEAQIGRFRSTVGSGLVYDDFGTGVNLKVDFDELDIGPLSTEFGTVIVGRRFDEMEVPSPLVSWRVDWNLSWFESLGLFAAVYFDRNGDATELVKYAYAESALELANNAASQLTLDSIFSAKQGKGTIGYIGVDSRLNPVKALSVRATALWSPGTVKVRLGANQKRTITLSSYAANAEVHYGASELIDLGLVGFILSGGGPLRSDSKSYAGFIGVAPYWAWTGLFFSSGSLNQALMPRRAASAGIDGHGVFGGGPVLTLTTEVCQAELRAVWLRALVAPPAFINADGKDYGLELDASVSIELFSWLSLGVESNLLVPGSYLPTSRPAYRAIGQIKVSYGG
jgi:hypothetical protein